VPSLGQRLRREREQRGISLDEISLSTKIGTRFLLAMEEDKFDKLPGGVFNKGFIRAYARRVGIDEEQAVADYLDAVRETAPANELETSPEVFPVLLPEVAKKSVAEQIPWGVLASLLLAVALASCVWSYYRRPLPRPGPYRVPTVSKSSSFLVSIKAREDSWISITADGKVILDQILVAPAEKSVQAQKEVVIKAGNAGGLEFSFNGTKLPPQGDYGQVKSLNFGADGLQPQTTVKPSS